MKKAYEKPKMCWQPIRSNRAVADVCWGYAASGKPFYYNTYGTGYVKLYAVGKCGGAITFRKEFYPPTMSEEDHLRAQEETDRVIAQAIAQAGKKPQPYKNSLFSPDVDPSWS